MQRAVVAQHPTPSSCATRRRSMTSLEWLLSSPLPFHISEELPAVEELHTIKNTPSITLTTLWTLHTLSLHYGHHTLTHTLYIKDTTHTLTHCIKDTTHSLTTLRTLHTHTLTHYIKDTTHSLTTLRTLALVVKPHVLPGFVLKRATCDLGFCLDWHFPHCSLSGWYRM